MTVLYLVRHAHSDWTPNENRPLSALGLEDALRLAHILSSFPITQIISSPYRRARQTIQPFAEIMGLAILEDPLFRERDLGEIGVTSFKDAIYQSWLDVDFAYPKGESIRQAQRRALEGLTEYLHATSAAHIVISTHGNLLTSMLNHFDPDVSYPFWQNSTMPDIYRLDTEQRRGPKYTRIWQPLHGNSND